MHTFTFRVEEINHHLDGQKVISLTEIHTRIGAKFHPDPLHRMASIQISTFGLDLNQYQLGHIVEMKMSIVTADEESVRKRVANPDGLMMPFVSDSSLIRGPSIVDFVPMAVTDSDRAFVEIMREPVIVNFVPMDEDFLNSVPTEDVTGDDPSRVPTADDFPLSFASNGMRNESQLAQ